ncbi:MAG: antibiotic biosynthesis monooxygenase [Candidatus Thiodiazotropha sp.]|jgi:heme-degrading monooxygenase HmoA
MYAAIVTYHPDQALSKADIEARFEASTPLFASMPGLVRKYFCYDADQHEGVSVYIWESREAADACFDSPQFQDGFRSAFGCEPAIKIISVRHLVDNS